MNILGLSSQAEISKLSKSKTKHCEQRQARVNLIAKNAEPLFYFEIYRSKDSSRQIHCLLNDASIVVFSKKDYKIITVIIPETKTLDKYIKFVANMIEENDLTKLKRCAKLNRKSKASNIDNDMNIDIEDYMRRKLNIMSSERGDKN